MADRTTAAERAKWALADEYRRWEALFRDAAVRLETTPAAEPGQPVPYLSPHYRRLEEALDAALTGL